MEGVGGGGHTVARQWGSDQVWVEMILGKGWSGRRERRTYKPTGRLYYVVLGLGNDDKEEEEEEEKENLNQSTPQIENERVWRGEERVESQRMEESEERVDQRMEESEEPG